MATEDEVKQQILDKLSAKLKDPMINAGEMKTLAATWAIVIDPQYSKDLQAF